MDTSPTKYLPQECCGYKEQLTKNLRHSHIYVKFSSVVSKLWEFVGTQNNLNGIYFFPSKLKVKKASSFHLSLPERNPKISRFIVSIVRGSLSVGQVHSVCQNHFKSCTILCQWTEAIHVPPSGTARGHIWHLLWQWEHGVTWNEGELKHFQCFLLHCRCTPGWNDSQRRAWQAERKKRWNKWNHSFSSNHSCHCEEGKTTKCC